jgi:hypothetical protein
MNEKREENSKGLWLKNDETSKVDDNNVDMKKRLAF